MEQRVTFTRKELLDQFKEFPEAPEILKKKFDHPPFCHILSTYILRPVANEKNPFAIHHKSKQPIPGGRRGQHRPQEKDNLSDEDEEFQKVTTHEKRKFKDPNQVHPFYPASHPDTKVFNPKKKGDTEEHKKEEHPHKDEHHEGHHHRHHGRRHHKHGDHNDDHNEHKEEKKADDKKPEEKKVVD